MNVGSTGVGVLLCCGAGVSAEEVGGAPALVVDDLCRSPGAASAALRELGVSRVVLGLCEPRAARDLVASLRRAGAEPFGIETVTLGSRAGVPRALAAAVAKLRALPPGEPERTTISGGALSRRSLFRAAVVDHAPVAAIDEAACVGSGRCGVCVEVCPAGAIAARAGAPAVDASACTACADCVVRCPVSAIHLSGSSPAQLEAQLGRLLEDCDGVVLGCANAGATAPEGWALVELPTLRLVTPGWLLQIRALGRQAGLAPCDGPCCAGAAAVEAFAGRLRPAVLPEGARVRLAEPAATVEACEPDAGAGPIVDSASPLGLLELRPGRCTLCGACAAHCPTGALRLEEGDDGTRLTFDHAACTGCNRCSSVCPEDAVTVARGVDQQLLGARRELVTSVRETCEVCGEALPPLPLRRRLRELLPELAGSSLETCAVCARRDAGTR